MHHGDEKDRGTGGCSDNHTERRNKDREQNGEERSGVSMISADDRQIMIVVTKDVVLDETSPGVFVCPRLKRRIGALAVPSIPRAATKRLTIGAAVRRVNAVEVGSGSGGVVSCSFSNVVMEKCGWSRVWEYGKRRTSVASGIQTV